MGRIVVMNHLTLDGVMQGAGRPDEDTRDSFTHGGWARRSATAGDEVGKAMGQRMAAGAGWQGGCSDGGPMTTYWVTGTARAGHLRMR